MTCKPARESSTMPDLCQVTLFAPAGPASPAPPSRPAAKPAPPRPRPQPPKPKPAEKPVLFDINSVRKKPRPPVDDFSDVREVAKLDRERTPASASRMRRDDVVGRFSPSPGGTSSYDALISRLIKSNWIRPSQAMVGENPPAVSVEIRIALDGRITRPKVVKSSGISLLDASAVKAIERSNPLPIGIPSTMGLRYYDVTIVFRITEEV